ncbi:MAG TPA: hypothetical protein VF120_06980 [Ktedonobacterales bacterium]
MDAQPSDVTIHTASDLFARLGCTHIVSMSNRSQNIHLERTPAGFRLIFASHGPEQRLREFAGLDDVSAYLAQTFPPIEHILGDAVWQDISDYPAFPYSVSYRPLENPLELSIMPNSETAAAHGPHVIYGAASITTDGHFRYVVTPQADRLVVEYPAYTFTGHGGMAVLRPTHNFLDRLRLRAENVRLRRERPVHTVVRPGTTVVYGKPPADWRAHPQLIPVEPAQ